MNARPSIDTTDVLAAAADELGHGTVARLHSMPWWLRVVHVGIILNFVAQCAYVSWEVFVVLQPPGTIGPMFGHAAELPYELMVARRMYAQEGWLAFIGLAVYLGITEIGPRRRRH